jgi:hypothetical protein
MVEHGEGGVHRRTDERRFRPVRRRFALKENIARALKGQCHKISKIFLYYKNIKNSYLHFKLGHLMGVELKNLQQRITCGKTKKSSLNWKILHIEEIHLHQIPS